MSNRDERNPFPLIGALAVSLAIHALLALLTLFVPIVSTTGAHVEPQDAHEITFSFVDRPDTTDDAPAEDVPPAGSEPLPVPVPPEPPAAAEAAEPIVEEIPSAAPAGAPPSAERPAAATPELDSGAQAESVPDTSAGGRPRIDVSAALRDFGDALSRRPPSPAPSRGDSPTNVIVPDFSSLPSSGFGMGNLTFESADYDWTDYGRQIYMAIWRAWHNRLWLTADEFEKWAHGSGQWYLNNQTQVRFVIERNGQISGIAKEGASGCLPLDDSALDALAEVILPPLPRDFPRAAEIVHARFIAVGDVRQMRPVLGRLKALGVF